MNYNQFLEMIPEAALVAVLLIVFFADLFCNNKKVKTLGILSTLLLLLPLAASALAEPTMAFGGLYYTTDMANVMKVILTAGTIIVCPGWSVRDSTPLASFTNSSSRPCSACL